MATKNVSINAAVTLPAAFISAAPEPIGYKRRGELFERLPFVAATGSGEADAPYWAVPASGGYVGGYETGEAMALAFLKYLRDAEPDADGQTELADIVSSFAARIGQEGQKAVFARAQGLGDGVDSLHGQYLGFFHTLCQWLMLSAKHHGRALDSVSEQDLARKANAGLGFDYAAFQGYELAQDRKQMGA